MEETGEASSSCHKTYMSVSISHAQALSHTLGRAHRQDKRACDQSLPIHFSPEVLPELAYLCLVSEVGSGELLPLMRLKQSMKSEQLVLGGWNCY